jgi:hypothetical protein
MEKNSPCIDKLKLFDVARVICQFPCISSKNDAHLPKHANCPANEFARQFGYFPLLSDAGEKGDFNRLFKQ